MSVDLHTLAISLFVYYALVTLGLVLTLRTSRSTTYGLKWWLGGMIAITVASLARPLDALLPLFISIVVANTLAVVGLLGLAQQ